MAFSPWLAGTTLPSQAFAASAGPGTYALRARLRTAASGSAARDSVPRGIVVQ